MSAANHRMEVTNLLNDWVDNEKQAKNIINCLVQFLTEDVYWLDKNISKVDREILIAVAKRLEQQ